MARSIKVTPAANATEHEIAALVAVLKALRTVEDVTYLRRDDEPGPSGAEITLRVDGPWLCGPGRELAARLTEAEADLIHVLMAAAKRDGEIRGAKGVLSALRAESGDIADRWAVKSAASVTAAYASAAPKLEGTPWALIEDRGVYGFKSMRATDK